ncbi:hypothetical protein [Pseudomonas zeae]|uniref:hypothetical protein n=1 Tax=Pseudomonas zeae TaxID=2745510 RepID=UPI0039E1818F
MKKNIPIAVQRQYVQALIELLETARQNPTQALHDETLIAALKSQGTLCQLSLADQGIFKVSLNTFKRYCQDHAPGGFAALDRLRHAARSAIEQARQHVKSTRKSQKHLLLETRAENAQLLLDNLLLTRLLQLSMRQSQAYATYAGDTNLMALHQKELRELLDLLTCVRSDTRGEKLEKIIHTDPARPDPAFFSRS